MDVRKTLDAAVFLAAVVMMASPVGWAQSRTPTGEAAQPDYGSGASAGFLSNTHFNTPESDGRPGVQDYAEGMAAYHRGDFSHAVYMLKLAAHWAYEPAAYNLGVMYFQGEGVKANRPLGTAWMFIAAENGSPDYVSARHMMVINLDYSERTQALQDYRRLQEQFGHGAAMRRAKAQWAYAKAEETGTRVGGVVGELHVGVPAPSGSFHTAPAPGSAVGSHKSSWMQVLTGGAEDGSVAYRQFQESSNPYSPIFLKNRNGMATVGPLQTIGGAQKASPSKKSGAARPASSSSSGDP